MSKIKDQMERDHEQEMEQYYSFMKFVCDQNEVRKNDVTKEEEEDTKVPSTPGTSIVSQNTLKAANNVDYDPKIGA
jgi:hypothetical protein